MNNVDVLACPGGGGQCDPQLPLPLKVPQVGWVLFSAGPDGTVNGHTDQGCTWNFKVTLTGLELSSTTQECFNHDIGSSGNIIKWSVTVTGNHEHEEIVAVSHQPNGVDLIGTMKSGSRTRVDGSGGAKSFSRFLGGYTYNPADFSTLTNVVSTDKGTVYPEQGTVQFTRKNRGTILAHTPDGCNWTLAVWGNTAELDPAIQTCQLTDGEISLRLWAIVTDDGEQMNAFRAGSTTLRSAADKQLPLHRCADTIGSSRGRVMAAEVAWCERPVPAWRGALHRGLTHPRRTKPPGWAGTARVARRAPSKSRDARLMVLVHVTAC